MKRDFVSVVLPVYNGEKYICEAVDSILNQTYGNWELIIVDDCSHDATPQIVDAYAAKDCRITVIHNFENQKLPQSLNIGFSAASGTLLTWTSDDNRLRPNAIERMQWFFSTNQDAHMVKAGMCMIDDAGEYQREIQWDYGGNLCLYNNVGACFMYTRAVYEEIGSYDTDLFCVEDYDYWLRVEKRFGKIDYISDILYEYRLHAKSLTATKRELIDRQTIRLREKHLDYIVTSLRDDRASLFYFYGDSLNRGCSADLLKGIGRCMPEQRYEADAVSGSHKFIIFGAGEYGKRAALLLGERAYCFADNDREKVGQKKCGMRIISFEELSNLSDEHCVLIAVDIWKTGSMVDQLLAHGITNYCTYQYYLWRSKNCCAKS